jgi:SAM-dependent methyltransferase
MQEYYRERLHAQRLERAYAIAPPRVRQYLDAEIDHVLKLVAPEDVVLELGCGYGRVLEPLARRARLAYGIDTSFESLLRARELLVSRGNVRLVRMDAARLGFRDASFDRTVCIQNGISAFHVDMRDLLRESARVTRSGGLVLFSSYSDVFWEHRLDWFERQAAEGLTGTIDRVKTRDGTIVCTDGFTASTVGKRQFEDLARELGVAARVVEVDSSSVFCEIIVGARSRKGLTA